MRASSAATTGPSAPGASLRCGLPANSPTTRRRRRWSSPTAPTSRRRPSIASSPPGEQARATLVAASYGGVRGHPVAARPHGLGFGAGRGRACARPGARPVRRPGRAGRRRPAGGPPRALPLAARALHGARPAARRAPAGSRPAALADQIREAFEGRRASASARPASPRRADLRTKIRRLSSKRYRFRQYPQPSRCFSASARSESSSSRSRYGCILSSHLSQSLEFHPPPLRWSASCASRYAVPGAVATSRCRSGRRGSGPRPDS